MDPGSWIEVVGLAVTGIGLFLTWWRWSKRRHAIAESLRVLRRRTHNVEPVTSLAALSLNVSLNAPGTVIRTRSPVETRLDLIEEEQGRLAQRISDAVEAVRVDMGRLIASQASEREEVDRQIYNVNKVTRDLVGRATIDGIWVAIFGVLLTATGVALGAV